MGLDTGLYFANIRIPDHTNQDFMVHVMCAGV